MNENFTKNDMFIRILPAPFLLSLICRWLFPYLIKKCMDKRRKRLEEDWNEEEEY
jgi:hypothetical protein